MNPLFEVITLIIYTQFHPLNAFIKSPVIAILTQRVQYFGYEAIPGFRVVLSARLCLIRSNSQKAYDARAEESVGSTY